jgi:DNA recombination protein RmuC
VELSVLFVMGVILGATLGGLVLALWMRGRLAWVETARRVAESKLAAAESTANKIEEKFQALADAALRSNQGAFLEAARESLETVRAELSGDLEERHTAIEGAIQPLAAMLSRLESQVSDLENAREQALGSLQEQLESLAKETATLSGALRAPQVHGRWSEVTLRRIAELAGMVNHCDFVEPESRDGDDGLLSPDMIVKLPGGRLVVVDAKVPLDAYLEAASAAGESERRAALERHSQQLLAHVDLLSSKQYWSRLPGVPEMVVLFIPGDQFFSAALEHNPAMIEDAISRKVLLATPATLISVLKGIAYGWQQGQLAEKTEVVRKVTAEFYDRLQILQDHYADVGKHLENAVHAYNKSVASWESRLLPSLRRIRELGAVNGDEPVAPETVDLVPRTPTVVELS